MRRTPSTSSTVCALLTTAGPSSSHRVDSDTHHAASVTLHVGLVCATEGRRRCPEATAGADDEDASTWEVAGDARLAYAHARTPAAQMERRGLAVGVAVQVTRSRAAPSKWTTCVASGTLGREGQASVRHRGGAPRHAALAGASCGARRRLGDPIGDLCVSMVSHNSRHSGLP